ncbi:MAG: pentapeptide repeat-containing protein [Saprospiraceae bacterium]|nr:pentapeptide repeat-containing protein [Saprospiraceae bacterium]
MPTINNPGTITIEDGRFKFKIDAQLLWSGIYNALAHYFDTEYGGATKELLAAATSVSKTNTLEHKAYRLIFTALHKSCVSILTNQPEQERLLEKILKAGVLSTVFRLEMSQKIGAGTYTIDNNFFVAPQHTPFIIDAQADYRNFLCGSLGLEEIHANALSVILPGTFVRELALEWEASDYTELITFFKNPFLEPLKKLALREARHADLLQRFAKPAFNNPRVTLAEMYIEPDFWLHGSCIPEKEKNGENQFAGVEGKHGQHLFYRHKVQTSLHPFFLKWVKREPSFSFANEKDSMLIILGQPGQGKSSSFLRTIDQLLREYPGTVENIFLVRLREIESAAKLIDDPISILCKHLKLEDENQMKDSLLLLDGLDELYMSQGLSLVQIHDFVGRLRQQLKNNPTLSLRIALTSRTNYLKLDDLSAEDYLIVHLADLSLEQQKEWLRRYQKHYVQDCVLTENDLVKIAEEGNQSFRKIRELINQPILLQMIAASGMKIDQKANSALIYSQLFDKLVKRDWSPEDGQLDKFKKLNKDDLLRFLRTLALHIFQKPSDHEYARRLDFEQEGPLKDETERLAKKLGMEQLPLKEMVKDLLVSFYFQEVQRDSDEKRRADDNDSYAYEFLHKSLQEYLVAEKIWETCSTKFLAEEEEGEFRIQKVKEAYDLIAPLFERKVLTQEIADYLFEIIDNDEKTDKVKLKQRLKYFLPGLLKANFLWEHEHKEGEPPALDKVIGNFYGYWTVASAMISPLEVDVRNESAYLGVIEAENLIPRSKQADFFQTYSLLARAHSRKIVFIYQNLNRANLNRSFLSDANFHGANLSEANLNRANLSDANLHGSNLRGALLFRANLYRAKLNGAKLNGANLGEATLRGADLSGADLSGVDLNGADLNGADLSGANLIGADLSGANLNGADLSVADLSGANLSGANLSRSNLRGANLIGCILWRKSEASANFENASMEDTIGAEQAIGLEHANFKGTVYADKFSKKSKSKG